MSSYLRELCNAGILRHVTTYWPQETPPSSSDIPFVCRSSRVSDGSKPPTTRLQEQPADCSYSKESKAAAKNSVTLTHTRRSL